MFDLSVPYNFQPTNLAGEEDWNDVMTSVDKGVGRDVK
jgi:hypothetical protein